MDRFTQQVLSFIRARELIRGGEGIVIGLSGGADSSALAVVLTRLRPLLGIRLAALHVHHGLRGEEAQRDEEAARQLATSLGLDFHAAHVDVRSLMASSHMGEEEAARKLRYSALSDLGHELYGEDFLIALAHHSLDQAETILYHMLRGSGMSGLIGMSPRRDNIIRPLLMMTREDILDFLGKEGIGYVTDSTNLSSQGARNRLRNVIIPEMTYVNAAAAAHISALSEKAAAIDRYLRLEAAAYLKENALTKGGQVRLSATKLKEKDRVLRIYVIIEALRAIDVELKDWGDKHFSDIDKLLFLGQGKELSLPGGVRAYNACRDTWIQKGDRDGL